MASGIRKRAVNRDEGDGGDNCESVDNPAFIPFIPFIPVENFPRDLDGGLIQALNWNPSQFLCKYSDHPMALAPSEENDLGVQITSKVFDPHMSHCPTAPIPATISS